MDCREDPLSRRAAKLVLCVEAPLVVCVQVVGHVGRDYHALAYEEIDVSLQDWRKSSGTALQQLSVDDSKVPHGRERICEVRDVVQLIERQGCEAGALGTMNDRHDSKPSLNALGPATRVVKRISGFRHV